MDRTIKIECSILGRKIILPSNRIAIAAAFLSLLLAPVGVAQDSGSGQDTQQFRGPMGNGVYSKSIPANWSDNSNVSWSVEIPGGGWASPVVAGNKVFVTTAVAPDGSRPVGFGRGVQAMGSFFRSPAPSKPFSFEVHCLELSTGKTIWKQQIVSQKPPFKVHPSNSYSTESPVTDGEHVYAYFAAIGVVACLDMDGKEVWRREIGAFKTGNNFGTGSSLAIHENLVFVQCDNDQQSFVLAMNKNSGEDVWRKERKGGTSWASPVIWNNKERTELVTCGSGFVTSYEPTSGEILWTLTGAGSAYSASPTFDQERIYMGQSDRTSRGPLVAVNAGASGTFSISSGAEGVAWTEDSAAPGMCSPVVLEGRVYVLSQGILSCHDATTGKRLYRERLQDSSSVTSSLWAAGDKLFTLSESGKTSVVASGSEFQLVDSNAINGLYWSTPSATENALLMRSSDKLHCIRQ